MLRSRLAWVVATLAGAALAFACGSETTTPGQLVVVVTSDMDVPKDVDTIGVEVVSLGAVRFSNTFPISDQGVLIPASLTLVAGKDPSTPVTVRVIAGHAGKPPRVLREIITTVPPDRVAMLRVPLTWLSDGSAKPDPTPNDPLNHLGMISVCPAGQTDVAGTCVDQNVDVRGLPDYANEAVWGAASADQAAAFDVASCFAGSAVANVDASDCSIAGPAATHDHWNVAIKLANGSDGFCANGACYVALDNIPQDRALFTGWKDAGSKITLPPGVCAKMGKLGFQVVTSTACVTKQENMAVCGSGSSVKNCGIKSITPPPGDGGADAGPSGPITKVALGYLHSCALRGGKVLCWGQNVNGQLGRGSAVSGAFAPDYAQGLPDGVTDISSGADHVCAAASGKVYCWGSLINFGGTSQQGTPLIRNAPVLQVPSQGPAVYVSSAGPFDCAVNVDAAIDCWGLNNNSQLGPNAADGATYTTPVRAPAIPGFTTTLGLLVGTTCAMGTGGQIQCWGSNNDGELGRGTVGGPADPTPLPITGSAKAGPPIIAAGSNTACIIGGDSVIYCWGNNAEGQVGDAAPQFVATPTAIVGVSNPTDVCTGNVFTCALSNGSVQGQATVFCWGDGNNGSLGPKVSSGTSTTPVNVPLPSDFTPGHLACSSVNACAYDAAGTRIFCWGRNENGQITLPASTPLPPTEIHLPP